MSLRSNRCHGYAALAVLLGVLPGIAVAQQPKTPAPVCAFLNPEKAPRADLVETKLLAGTEATWVERTIIDKVLKEQTLQAVFGAQGGADRVQLGKLLKADLLVLVRPAKKTPAPALEAVVSDTARGLRLMVRAVPVTNDVDADVAALRDVVLAGLKKLKEHVREVVAVPPFASTNLSYQHEHLKGAYAKLVEQAVLAGPGVVVVELAEAEAIAREIKLTDPTSQVRRAPALYLLGEFRHQGQGKELQVELKLHATRGGKAVGELVRKTVAAQDAPAVLQKWAGERLAGEKGQQVVVLDAKAEAKQLAALSRARQRVGDWEDACALLEASLLLNPNQPELNDDAMAVLKIRMQQLLRKRQRDIELLRQVAALHRRGFEHFETLVQSRARLARWADSTPYDRGGRMFFSPFPFAPRLPPNSPFKPKPVPPAVQELSAELLQERRNLLLRLMPLIAKDGNQQEFRFAVNMVTVDMPQAERLDELVRLILLYQDDSPAAVAIAGQFARLSINANKLEDVPIYRKRIERLIREGNAAMRAAATQSLQILERTEKDMLRAAALAERNKLPPPRPIKVNSLGYAQRLAQLDKQFASGPLRRIPLKAAAKDDEELLSRIQGVIAAGPGIDVFWASSVYMPRSQYPSPVLYVMKEKGQLRRVWTQPGAPDQFAAVCFDGRFVWAATEAIKKAPALFIFDPVAEKVVEVTAADGLPQPPDELVRKPAPGEMLWLRLSPLEPGKVCVSGGFGRAWVGVATFDPLTGKATLKVIHEAREVSNQADKNAWSNPQLAFTPVYMYTVRGQAKAAGVRVLIGRDTRWGSGTGDIAELGAHPLIVDPEHASVAIMKFPHYIRNLATAPDGSCRFVEWSPRNYKIRLYRIDFPGKVRDMGELDIPESGVRTATAFFGDRLHVITEQRTVSPGHLPGSLWWTAKLDGSDVRKEADDLPMVLTLARSSHYGLVGLLDLTYGRAFCEFHVQQKK